MLRCHPKADDADNPRPDQKLFNLKDYKEKVERKKKHKTCLINETNYKKEKVQKMGSDQWKSSAQRKAE